MKLKTLKQHLDNYFIFGDSEKSVIVKNDFQKSIQYAIIKDGIKNWKFSLSSYNKNNTTAYYYCSDITYKARGLIKFSLDINSEFKKI